MKNKIGALILAAGKSQRMGFPKANLPFGDQETFLEKIVSVFRKTGINDITVVINISFKNNLMIKENGFSEIQWVLNPKQESERSFSIFLGLSKIQHLDFCFIQNVDNPFISITLLNKMLEKRQADHYVVPTFDNKHGHPILIDHSFINRIIKSQEMEFDFREALKNQKKISVPFDDESILSNINTPQDYQKYFKNYSYANQES